MDDNKNTLILWLVLLLGGLIWGIADARADSPQLDGLAQRMTGVGDARISCFPTNGEWGGFVILSSYGGGQKYTWEDHTIYLDGGDCGALQNVLTPGPRTFRWERSFDGSMTIGQAVMHLEHEVTHVRLLSADEGLVECTAYHNVWQDLPALQLDWKAKKAVYRGATYNHLAKPTTGTYAEYRSVC